MDVVRRRPAAGARRGQAAADRLGGTARGLDSWESVQLTGSNTVTVTATPAQHGPEGCEAVTGPVIGFVLTATGLPTVYVSGDNASLGALLTLDSTQAAQAAMPLPVTTPNRL